MPTPAEREVGGAGLDLRVAQDVLHVQGEEEEHRVEAREREQLGDVGGGQAPDAEDRQRDERVVRALLVDDEFGQEQDGLTSSLIVRAEPQPWFGACTSA